MIINAQRQILGRMAAIAAKKALLGEDVKIINCEQAVITGRKNTIIRDYSKKLELGQPQQGPFMQKRPDMFVRRVIRSMLPRKQFKGRQAFERVKCYIGTPEGLTEKATTPKESALAATTRFPHITVGELCMHRGGRR